MSLAAAEFDIRGLTLVHQGKRRSIQHVPGFGVDRKGAAFDAERRSNKSAAKKKASLVHEGKNTGDLSGSLRNQKMGLEPKNGFEDRAPARQMKECSAR